MQFPKVIFIINSFGTDTLQESHHSLCHCWLWELSQLSPQGHPPWWGATCSISACAVLRISSLLSPDRMGHYYNEDFSLSFCWCHWAALRAAKATGMSGRLLANVKLTLEQRPLKFRRQIYLSYELNKIKQISTSCWRWAAQPPR